MGRQIGNTMIIIHTKLPKSKRKKKLKGPIQKKINIAKLQSLMTETYRPVNNQYLRPGSDQASKIKSHITNTQFVPNRTGVMDPAFLAKESPEVRDAIIAKSKRIAIAYSKGAYQYVTDEADAKTIGRKNPI
jgi:hypothetical protein